MFRIQKCNTHEQALTNHVFISLENNNIPLDTQYVVVNRQWVFALSRISDCPTNAILTNCSTRKLMDARLDSLVIVEPLSNVRSPCVYYKQQTFLAMFRMENPEVGPPSVFRKLAAEVLHSLLSVKMLNSFKILEMNESSIEFVIAEYWHDTIMERFQSNYNNVGYYFNSLLKVSDVKNSYLNDLDEENQVLALDKLEIEIPNFDKVAGTFAGLDYGECVCHVIQPNTSRLYEYIKQRMINTVIYNGMSLIVDPRECFGLDSDVAMLFHVRPVPIQPRLGILTPETVIEFVN